MKKRVHIALLLLTLVFVLACGSGTAATPTPNLEATMGAAIAQTKAAQQNAQPAAPVVDLQATVDAQVQATLAAQLAAAQSEANPAPEDSQPAQPPAPPAQPEPPQPSGDLAATQQAQPMYDFVQQLKNKANLWSAEGIYHHVGSFDQRSMKPNWFSWWFADGDYDSYVIRADISWRAPNGADPADNGCGFVWAYAGDDNWHVTILDLEGTVHTYRQRGSGEKIEMKGGKYLGGLGRTSGEAEMVITVEDDLYTAFINGMEVVRFKDPYIATGKIGMAIKNGESPDGMHCMMENIGIWELQ